MNGTDYVHGYSERESLRLADQANTLTELLHHDSLFPEGSHILEAGCGVGAQTVILARNNPGIHITSIDISPESVRLAEEKTRAAGFCNVQFQQADLFHLPFEPETFDHIFVCFVLEHLSDPVAALQSLKKVLKPGGTITVIEGDHGSAYFHPDSAYAHQAIQCQVTLQAQAGGDSMIGRRLYPLLTQAEYQDVQVSPRMVYVDGSKPLWIEGFTKNTFTAMIEGVRGPALAQKLMAESDWEKGIAGLYRTAESDGVFCYCFFKAIARK